MQTDPSSAEVDRTSPSSAPGGAGGKRGYQAPRLTVFGTIAELTYGNRLNRNKDVLFAGSGGPGG